MKQIYLFPRLCLHLLIVAPLFGSILYGCGGGGGPSGPIATTTSLTPSANAALVGTQITLTAVVAPSGGSGIPSGTVTFSDGGTTLGTVNLNASGQAAYSTSSFALGTHSLTAAYGGSTANTASSSPPVMVTIASSQAATTTTLQPSASSVLFGGSITFTATVAQTSGSTVPAGIVNFYLGTTQIGSGSLSNTGQATFSTASLPQGVDSLTATYVGDAIDSASTSAATSVTITQNVAAVTVDDTLNSFNSLYVTLIICKHGSTTNCVTVDHVAIDTGSIGLRVLQSSFNALSPNFLASVPPIQATSSTNASVTGPLGECAQFGGGYTWGSIRSVDITIAGTTESASNIPMQVIGDLGGTQATCSLQSATQAPLSGANNAQTAQNLGSNGLIGISLFQWDCLACTTSAEPPGGTNGNTPQLAYVVCPDTSGVNCSPTATPVSEQVANPIPSFANDNNGYSINMPALTAIAGSSTPISGTWTLGIGTESNNSLGTATKFNADPTEEPAFIQTKWQGQYYSGLFDTGSSAYYFANTTPPIALCTAPIDTIYCPGGATATANSTGTTLSLSATNQDYNEDVSPASTVNFSVTNPLANYTNSTFASDNLGGTEVFTYFIWGMPYFYGRKLFFGMEVIDPATNTYSQGAYYAF